MLGRTAGIPPYVILPEPALVSSRVQLRVIQSGSEEANSFQAVRLLICHTEHSRVNLTAQREGILPFGVLVGSPKTTSVLLMQPGAADNLAIQPLRY